jgi:hypothetical protein
VHSLVSARSNALFLSYSEAREGEMGWGMEIGEGRGSRDGKRNGGDEGGREKERWVRKAGVRGCGMEGM